ncbi:MAG: DUF3299 domain-containing protein [Magnetovibrio sp.]|nr:DUF3299 domain-containing protein [Magnetovibrio sp.]
MFRFLYGIFFVCLMVSPLSAVAEQVREVNWEDLAAPTPPEIQKELDALNELDLMDEIALEEADAKWEALQEKAYPVVEALDGETIRIPGFVVPVDLEADVVREFLLVPYLGACIHVPPPPPNQVIYVKSPQEYTVEELFDPVWVTGQIQVSTTNTDLAESGYILNADDIVRYVVD